MNLSEIVPHDEPILLGVFLLLAGMSVLSWYVIFWKTWSLARERRRITRFRTAAAQTPDRPHHLQAQHATGAVAELLHEAARLPAMLAERKCDRAQAREQVGVRLAQALDRLRLRLDRGLTLLASVGSSAPFIGLFGTVWGVYNALVHIAAAGNAGLDVVAGPMGQALVATAAGLFAAIPAVLAYNAFVRGNRVLVQELRHIAEQVTLQLCAEPHASVPEPIKLVNGGR